MSMNKTLLAIVAMIVFSTFVTAADVDLVDTLDVSISIPETINFDTSWAHEVVQDDAICLTYRFNDPNNQNRFKCWGLPETGTFALYTASGGTNRLWTGFDITDDEEYMLWTDSINTGGSYRIVDVRSPAFYGQDVNIPGITGTELNQARIVERNGNEITVVASELGTIVTTGLNVMNANASFNHTGVSSCVALQNEGIIDRENDWYVTGDEILRYEINSPTTNCTSLWNATDDIMLWNMKGNDPKFLLDNGKVLLCNAAMSSCAETGTVFDTSFKPLYWWSDEFIVGKLNNTWYKLDVSSLLLLQLTSLGVTYNGGESLHPNGAPSYPEASAYNDRLVTFNSTDETFYIWEFDIPETTCEVVGGCYLNDTFEYADNVLGHGWTGTSQNPSNGDLICDATMDSYEYAIPSVTESTGTVVLQMNVDVCGADSDNVLYTSVGDGGVNALFLKVQADGNITDWEGSDIGDFNVTCDGNYHNLSTFIHFQNNPKTYDLYVDGALQSTNNQFTPSGQGLSRLSWVFVGSYIFPPYCDWNMSSISLTTETAFLAEQGGETINRTEEFLAEARQWGCFITGGDDKGFDETMCKDGEDMNWCFLRCNVEAVGTWGWQAFTNNILITLFFVIVLLGVVMVKKHSN